MNDTELLQQLAGALSHIGPVAKTPITTHAYDEGGLFGTCKQDRTLINAMVGPFGIMGAIPWFGTDVENPIYQALTYMGSSGYAQSGMCADCGTPVIKRCAQSACFGRVCQATEEMVIDEIGLRANANVPRVALFGNIVDPQGNVLVRMGEVVTDLFMLQLAAAAFNLRRKIGELMWSGNPVNNVGGYWEPVGFDLLIRVGHTDALTHIPCDALDSQLVDFGSAIVGATGSPSVVAYVSGIVRAIRYRINTAGLDVDSAVIKIVMHPNIWDCVANAWACEYGIVCQTGATSTNDAVVVARMRDEFINRMVLRIDGKEYPVVLDNSISQGLTYIGDETGFCSDIYVITTAVNGEAITYGQFQDLNKTGGSVRAWFNKLFGATPVQFTDGGRYAVAPVTSGGFCFDARTLTKPRIIAKMPQLLGRVQNVCCIPLRPYPAVTGSGGLYEVDGGATYVPPNYLYGPCWPDAGSGWAGGPR